MRPDFALRGLARISQCAVKGVDSQWVQIPPGTGGTCCWTASDPATDGRSDEKPAAMWLEIRPATAAIKTQDREPTPRAA